MLLELILFILIVVYLYKSCKKPEKYPPGLWGIPLFGNLLPFIREKNIERYLTEKQKEWGDIIMWRIGTQNMVMLFNYQDIKEFYSKNDFANRPNVDSLRLAQGEKNIGVISSNGLPWHNNRRYILRQLRDLGMGKSRIVASVQLEASEMINHIRKTAGGPQKPPRVLQTAVLNVVWQMVASHRYDYDDPEMARFQSILLEANKNLNILLVPTFFPWIKSVLPNFINRKLFKRDLIDDVVGTSKDFMKRFVKSHKKSLDPDNPQDYIDSYLLEMKSEDKANADMSEEDLVQCLLDLFNAGSGTTSSNLIWCILYLAAYPEVQKKLQKEIDDVLPNGAMASLEDKPRLNYTEAFIHEIHRHASLLSSGVFRTVTQDTEVGGYIVPKESLIMSMAAHCHLNKENWEKADDFWPERFLDSDGKFVHPKKNFLPFGIGKRQCVGEGLARLELTIFITALVQAFNFKPVPGKPVNLKPFEIVIFHMANEEQDIIIEARN